MDPLGEWNQSRWNQLNELEEMRDTLQGLFGNSDFTRPEKDAGAPEWIPVVDVCEDARGYVIKAELPQVKKEDVKITMEAGMLTITGERKFGQNSKKGQPPALACGRFVHCFAVPSDAHPTRVTAVFTNEVLTVHLARNRKPRPASSERSSSGKHSPADDGHRSSGAPGPNF